MPDQSSAATEHAIMQEINTPLANLPDDPVASVADKDFPIVLRGYDREAVDRYVKRVTELVAELYATRSPEGAVRRALERVGGEVSAILQRAHDTAEHITSQSRSEAEERLMKAREEAEELDSRSRQQAREIEQAAERRVAELDAEVDRIWAERDRIVGDVRKLSDDLAGLAGAAATRFPAAGGEDPGALPTRGAPPAAAAAPATTQAGGEPTAAYDQLPPELVLTELTDADSETEIRVIDLLHLGRERVIGCWQIGDVLIDPGPSSCLENLLEGLGGEQPRAVLLTHIHLDHAGAAGSLVRRWPDLEVYVHERGAPHLTDPTRLLESARRLYGDDMERLWGEVLAVPSANLHLLRGGEQILDGMFEVAYTPGHASHHVSYFCDGIAFVGDVGGVRITPQTLTIPPTPPPDIEIEAWHESIGRVLAWQPERLAMTHFGWTDDARAQLDELSERLDTWAALARTEDLETFVATVRQEIEADAGAELLPAYEQAAPPEQLYGGLERYWGKLAEDKDRDEAADGAEEAEQPTAESGSAAASTHAGRSAQGGRELS